MTLSTTTFNIKGIFVTLSITAICIECNCRVSFIVMLNVIRLSVIMLTVVMLVVIMLVVIMLVVIMLIVIFSNHLTFQVLSK
jgi:hypothetical protein